MFPVRSTDLQIDRSVCSIRTGNWVLRNNNYTRHVDLKSNTCSTVLKVVLGGGGPKRETGSSRHGGGSCRHPSRTRRNSSRSPCPQKSFVSGTRCESQNQYHVGVYEGTGTRVIWRKIFAFTFCVFVVSIFYGSIQKWLPFFSLIFYT